MIFLEGALRTGLILILLFCIWLTYFLFKKINFFQAIVSSGFAIYLIMLISVTCFPIAFRMTDNSFISPEFNYIPFNSIREILQAPSLGFKLLQIGGNIILLMPLIFFILILFNNINTKKVFLIGLFTSLLIESIQFFIDGFLSEFSSRCVDIDDVILNCLGIAIMILFYNYLKKPIKKIEAILVE